MGRSLPRGNRGRDLFQLCCPLSSPPNRAATQELALLISRMQANADQVERDILETQKRLQQVRPDRQIARCGAMGGPLSGPGVPTDHGEDGTDDFCPSLATPHTVE